MIRPITKSLLVVLGALWAPLALATSEYQEGCEPFNKEVSVDGGLTWFDADTVDDAPVVELGTEVQYRFILKNCLKQDDYGNWFGKKCWDTTVSDALIFGLDEFGEEIRVDVEDGDKQVIEPGQTVTITYDQTVIEERRKANVVFTHADDSPFQGLLRPDRCDTPGDKLNTATEWTTAGFYRTPEDPMSDDAWVRCEGDEPLPASLGDRVWEDLDRDGVQDCTDGGAGDPNFPADGIIGNDGDSGDECNAGIASVAVDLFEGDCTTPVSSTVTDANGFYLFDNLDAGEYCVGFVKPGNEFCDTDGFALGMPQFTMMNVGDADSDSDADETTGITAPTTLDAGENDLTIDAGIYCPAKIGDYVFIDNNEDGVQDGGDDPLEGVEVTLWDCGPDMVAGTSDDVMTEQMRTTDEFGMYMFGAETDYTLEPGKYFVQFDPATLPAGYDFTTAGVGDDALDSDCLPTDGITACTDLTASRAINLARDCGVVPPPPPECNLTLDKFCSVVPAPSADFEKCSGKLEEFTLVWAGTGTITAAGPNNTVTVSNGEEATFFGPFDNNDVEVTITGDVTGSSVFHVSCSDEDFNDPTDCGKMAGDGKSNDTSRINDWQLEGFVDADGTVLDCTPDGGEEFAENCTFEQPELPTCDNGEKPNELTWRYDGGTGGDGDCADSTFFTIVDADGKGHDDFVCEGDINAADTITVTDDGGNAYTVAPGESFTTLRDDIGSMTLTDASGGSQSLVFHTSCSQPLEATATAGALTLTALDDRTGGQDVTYRYDVTNLGDELTNVTVDDDQLGIVLSGLTMANGDFTSVDVVATLFGTTTNTAQASGTLADGSVCAPTSAFDTVTVEAVVPACSVGVELDKVEDDTFKIKLTNNDTLDRTLTMDTLTVSYPAARGLIDRVKLNGDAYKYDDSAAPILDNPAVFGSGDWTATEVSKRQIQVGETKTLEVQTFDKGDADDLIEVTVDFGDGCVETIIVENQAIVN